MIRAWLAFLVSVSVVAAAEPVAIAGRAMGTTWVVKFMPGEGAPATGEISGAVAVRLEQLEAIFSTYRNDSELSRFNATAANSTEWFPVSVELAQVAIASRGVSELTGGAFDATVEPLVALWGFGPHPRIAEAAPLPREIAAVRARVGWRGLEARTEPAALRRTRPGGTADFSSMAKGFASDAVSALLAARGLANHFVQVGGDVRTLGRGPAGEGWRVGIESPDATGALLRTVRLASEAVSTSGNYRNVVVRDGRRFGHIIDPRTGLPAAGALVAVSVVADSCARSSALATGLFVLGADDGYALAQAQGLACVFVVRESGTKEFAVHATPAFERRR